MVDFLKGYEINIEKLRSNEFEFSHLSDQIYLDYAANSVYMQSLIKDFHEKLTNKSKSSWNLFSNPHSHSQSGIYTNLYVDLTRQKILNLFNTNSNEYDVIFVMNATHALKLLAESFNFEVESENDKNVNFSNNQLSKPCFAYLKDNHTSVIGMRELVWQQNTNINVFCLFENENSANPDIFESKLIEYSFNQYKPEQGHDKTKIYNLLVYPAQSNFNGRKYDLNWIKIIKENGLKNVNQIGDWMICLDTASFVCSSHLDLSENKPDFLVLSFYKIFGFPTGIGALLVKKSKQTIECMNKKQYFGGGTVSTALIDNNKVCLKNCSFKKNGTHQIKNAVFHEFFEDGTISYLEIIGLSLAIDKFKQITFNQEFKLIQIYLNQLTEYCIEELTNLKHFNEKSLVEIYRKRMDDSITKSYGPIISFNLKDSNDIYIGYSLVDKLAQENNIHLRTGCFCNIGACQLFLNHLNDSKTYLENFELHGHKCGDHIDLINKKPTGAIRISFGYSSIKKDIEYFIKFLKDNFLETDKNVRNHLEVESLKLIPETQFFKITYLYLYPIKSCAPMKIENSWPLVNNLGLKYDRNFIIIDSNGIALTQKRFPVLTKLIPFIDLNKEMLILKFENESFELNLEEKDEKIVKKSVILANNLTGLDQGEDVSCWLSRAFGLKDNCRLIKIDNQNDTKTFVNKADFLLITENSIQNLREFLLKSLNDENKETLNDESKLKLIDNFLLLQFRPNIAVSVLGANSEIFNEEYWSDIEFLNRDIKFNIVNNCTRCQMININQNFVDLDSNANYAIDTSLLCSSLLKQLYKLKSNSQFGIYLSISNKIKNDSSDLNINDEINFNYFNQKNNQISIGDICKTICKKKEL